MITSRINNRIAPIAFAASEPAAFSFPSRFESYQIFSTDSRRVNILKGDDTMRAKMPSAFGPDSVRKRRGDVSTLSHNTTNRPSRFSLNANEPSSAQ